MLGGEVAGLAMPVALTGRMLENHGFAPAILSLALIQALSLAYGCAILERRCARRVIALSAGALAIWLGLFALLPSLWGEWTAPRILFNRALLMGSVLFSRIRLASLAFASVCLSACASMERLPYTASASSAAMILPADEAKAPIRFWAGGDRSRYDAWIARVLADRKAGGLAAPRAMLVISGGSDKGAYSAGLLNAWSEQGSRPVFDMVTGVSTGALIAPFAFLGEAEDDTLTEIYTGIGPKDVYRSRPLGVLFGRSALARTEPLQALIAKYTTRDFLDRIAAEHRKGRRLLVMTTELDSARGMIWDMGAIAASASPDAGDLFRQVLLASASIPGAFPPVMVEASDETSSFAEMHVDGGVVSSFFVLPLELLELRGQTNGQARKTGRIWILYNGRVQPKFAVTKADALSILQRSLAVTLSAHDKSFLASLAAFGRENDVIISMCAIERDIPAEQAEMFDTERMNQFYQMGTFDARADESCLERALSQ